MDVRQYLLHPSSHFSRKVDKTVLLTGNNDLPGDNTLLFSAASLEKIRLWVKKKQFTGYLVLLPV
jgi:hypothetical protein